MLFKIMPLFAIAYHLFIAYSIYTELDFAFVETMAKISAWVFGISGFMTLILLAGTMSAVRHFNRDHLGLFTVNDIERNRNPAWGVALIISVLLAALACHEADWSFLGSYLALIAMINYASVLWYRDLVEKCRWYLVGSGQVTWTDLGRPEWED